MTTDQASRIPVGGLFTGTVKPLPTDGQASGIFKEPVAGPADIGTLALEGDQQWDRRVEQRLDWLHDRTHGPMS